MTDAHFVVDIAVGDGNVGEREIGDRKALDHLVDDKCADIFIGTDGLVAGILDGGTKRCFPETIEVDLVGRSTSRWSTRGFGTVRHNHEADGWHDDLGKRFYSSDLTAVFT